MPLLNFTIFPLHMHNKINFPLASDAQQGTGEALHQLCEQLCCCHAHLGALHHEENSIRPILEGEVHV